MRETLVQKGWTEAKAFVAPGTPTSACTRATRSADAARKAAEREELKKTGWRQNNVIAPDNPLAREFLTAAAVKIKPKKMLNVLRAALEDLELVMIGRRVPRLRGDAADQVRKLLDL